MADEIINGGPPPPPKPISSKKWAVYIFAGLFGLFVVLELISGIRSNPDVHHTTSQAPNASGLEAIRQFEKTTAATAESLAKQRAALQKLVANPNFPELLFPLPECNQAMRDKLGVNYYAAQTTAGATIHLICGSNDQWAIIPEAATSISPMTARQEQSEYRHGTGGVSESEKKRQEKEKARHEALNSSSVALDYVQAKAPKDESGLPVIPSAVGRKLAVLPTSVRRRLASEDLDKPDETGAPEPDAKAKKYEWDSSTGPLYKVFEGSVLETILTNRLQGEFTGPVNVMVTTDLWSHDHQHVLLPQGTRVIGEAGRVNTSGQRRLAVVFHRIIMPDGYSVDLSKFAGSDQQGASGLTGRVNTHWLKLVATAAAVGAIGGLAEAGANGVGYTGIGAIRAGVGEQAGQEGMQILNRALNQMPTITVYEGTRVRIWVKSDIDLPAFENHTVPPTL
jgi:type IV secretory pathway VirB10-like protein